MELYHLAQTWTRPVFAPILSTTRSIFGHQSTSRSMALDPKNLSVQHTPLHVPDLDEVANVLKTSLTANFANVDVQVVDCPDLTEQPFTLAGVGLGGSPRLIEVGGPPFLLPLVQRDKVYDLRDLPKLSGLDSTTAVIVGAGAGPHPHVGINCEGIINIKVNGDGSVDQQTRITKVEPCDGSFVHERLPNAETRFALLGNFYESQGQPGRVLRVHVRERTGADDFISSIRKSLLQHYSEKIVGLGGTFLIKEGKVKQHVMPDFSKTPLTSDNKLNEWLKFYEMSAPLIAVGTLVTGDLDLDLRVQHFHSFSHHGEGGHYHYDTTPDTVEYLAYFNVAEEVYRIDRPVETHQFGRD